MFNVTLEINGLLSEPIYCDTYQKALWFYNVFNESSIAETHESQYVTVRLTGENSLIKTFIIEEEYCCEKCNKDFV